MVAVDVILGQQKGEARPDVVVSIVDASNLERNLYLTTQALELGVPVVVALNMIDVAQGQGLAIDVRAAVRQLGVPVVPIQANKHKGLDQLQARASPESRRRPRSRQPDLPPSRGRRFPEAFEREVACLHQAVGDGRAGLPGAAAAAGCGRLHGATPGPATTGELQAHGAGGPPAPGRGRLSGAGRGGPHPLRLDPRSDGRLHPAARRSGPSPGPTASTGS